MSKRLINESFQISGEWFLPDTTTQIAGMLSWGSQKAYLHLNNSFTPLPKAFHADNQSYPVVHGITTDSQRITVLDAMSVQTGLNFGSAGLRQSEKLLSTCVVSGAHVLQNTLYSEMRFRIPGLQIWLSRSGVTQTFSEKTDNHPVTISYQIQGLAEETFRIPSIKAILGWGIDRIFSGNLVTDIAVKTSAALRVRPDEPKPLEWYLREVSKATTLLSFMAGSPMSPDHIDATLAEGEYKAEILVALRESGYCSHKNPAEFYMLRSAMDVDFAHVFNRWFEAYETIAMPSQLALSIFSSEKLWLHVEFLSLMQALEGFHRATMPGLYTTVLEYEKVRHALSNAIPKDVASDHRDALRKRIEYGNEISLRKRLNDLVQRLDLSLREIILGYDGTVPSSWVLTRNYYTHWDETSRESALDGLAMHQANVRLRQLLKTLYLDLVGIPQSAIAKTLLNASDECQYLAQLNSMDQHKNNPDDNTKAT